MDHAPLGRPNQVSHNTHMAARLSVLRPLAEGSSLGKSLFGGGGGAVTKDRFH